MEFKVGDKVKRTKEAIRNGDVCGDCVPKGIPAICEIVGKDGGGWTVKCPNGTTEFMSEDKIELAGKKEKPKNPTHLVVWEVDGCGDPCKFFTNEKEAREEVKTLSELSGVKKDSIILIEIKSAQKVNVIRLVRLNQHKI